MRLISNIFLFLFVLSLVPVAYAVEPQITITETSGITDLKNGQFSLSTNGVVEIYNPSNVSRIYEVSIPLNLDSLIGISKVTIDNTSDSFEIEFDRIRGYFIGPNQTFRFGYRIFGLTNSNVHNLAASDESMFEYYAEDFQLIGQTIISLDKPQREGENYNQSGALVSSTLGSNSTRIVSASVRNPTDFDYFLNEMKLYKTEASDPLFSEGDLVSMFQNVSISPFGLHTIDFTDITSTDNSVYWVSADITMISFVNSSFSRTFSVFESPPSGGGGSRGGSSGGGGFGNFIDDEPEILDSLLIKKSVNKTVVRRGDEFEVILRIVNINDFVLEDLLVIDEIPRNYELKDVSKSVDIKDRELRFEIEEVGEFETYVIRYTLVNNAANLGVTFLKPAQLEFDGQFYFSEGILLINELLPDQRVFVQKEIDYIDNNFARVVIRVKNLGSIPLEDLLVADDIPDDVLIKEISRLFKERGVWEIEKLEAGEEWEVSYLVERNPSLDNIPNIYGIDQDKVFGTIISSEEILTVFGGNEPRLVEKVGLGLAVGLLIIYLLF